jgi:DNA-binding CsgD family transcriptional regulator
MIISGLIDQHTEYFTEGGENYKAHHGLVVQVQGLGDGFKALIWNFIKHQPTLHKKLQLMGASAKEEMVNQYYDCNYSEADGFPDALGQREFKRCPKRGNCPGESFVCTNPYLLTIKETQVLKFIGFGLLDKEICHQLHISNSTLRNHKDHISIKTNTKRKAELSIIASQLNLI